MAVTDDGTVVADGGYVALDDGDGEFAITVTQPWRGWLGPYLLDVLFQQAAAHGLENLHAEILRNNRRMLALIEHRGYASFDQPDWTMASVTVSATGGRPSWPPEHARRRLLVEGCAGHWGQAEAARAAGWDVVTCSGPGERSVPMCPLVEGAPCPLVEGADLVVVAPPRADARVDELLAGHERSSSVQPVIAADLDEASLTHLLGAGGDLGQDEIVHGEACGAQGGADRAPNPH